MAEQGIHNKVQLALEASEFDAILATGADNVQYLSGAAPPFLPYRPDQRLIVFWPKKGEPVLLCPPDLESTARRLGGTETVQTYSPTGEDPAGLAAAVARLAGTLEQQPPTLGIDTQQTPYALYEALAVALPGARLIAGDDWLRELRMVKTVPEQALLEEIAYTTDHGLNGSLHHVAVESPRTRLTESEQIRIHCLERGLEETGYHSAALVAGGPAARTLWPLDPRHGFNHGFGSTGKLQPGQMVRMNMRATRDGYWSDACRILVTGQPTAEQAAAYQSLVALREAMTASIRPGVPCSSVYHGAVTAAESEGIDLVSQLGLGHGVGVAVEESPYLAADDDTLLEEGMVLVLAPVVRGPDDELLCSKDTVIITGEGCRIVGWWKDWREPYIPIPII